ncbi:aldo/keto reductase [Deinococcus pimensis]|uniref:aldo/keto reductase n=1 Tax=Deinococcus pimensis TaxID=309888 RepID=UPI000486E27A|nr:aldo/keto reductase [Deinococcus pimensis]
MLEREFGNTGLRVSALGFGAGHVGGHDLGEDEAGTVLNRAVDLGVTLIDTARGYGLAEERVGRHLSHRRDDFVLSTKGGYGVEGTDDWTPENIRLGIERALRVMRTDRIDVFHLHSCPLDVARREDLLAELDRAREAGLVRVTAYSGENAALDWAVGSGRFGSVQTSVNLADQRSLHHDLPRAREAGLGVIAKRPLANAPWRFAERPTGQYAEVYWDRLKVLALDPAGLDWDEFALRFSTFAPGVSSAIAGTRSPERLARNAEIVARGPLPQDVLDRVEASWAEHGADWGGEV